MLFRKEAIADSYWIKMLFSFLNDIGLRLMTLLAAFIPLHLLWK
jgi:hypothetical protein